MRSVFFLQLWTQGQPSTSPFGVKKGDAPFALYHIKHIWTPVMAGLCSFSSNLWTSLILPDPKIVYHLLDHEELAPITVLEWKFRQGSKAQSHQVTRVRPPSPHVGISMSREAQIMYQQSSKKVKMSWPFNICLSWGGIWCNQIQSGDYYALRYDNRGDRGDGGTRTSEPPTLGTCSSGRSSGLCPFCKPQHKPMWKWNTLQKIMSWLH